jgi:putative addiction module killer protein
MPRIEKTRAFIIWQRKLRDERAAAKIAVAITRLGYGHGDVASVGDGVSEVRVEYGPGYRVYFTRRGGQLIILLCGGDKSSQDRDIRKAKEMAAAL